MVQKVGAFTCEKFPHCCFFFHFEPAVDIFLLCLLCLYKFMPRFTLLIEEERKPPTVAKSLTASVSNSSESLKRPLKAILKTDVFLQNIGNMKVLNLKITQYDKSVFEGCRKKKIVGSLQRLRNLICSAVAGKRGCMRASYFPDGMIKVQKDWVFIGT